MVFITIMTRGAAGFFRFFRKNLPKGRQLAKSQVASKLLRSAIWTEGQDI